MWTHHSYWSPAVLSPWRLSCPSSQWWLAPSPSWSPGPRPPLTAGSSAVAWYHWNKERMTSGLAWLAATSKPTLFWFRERPCVGGGLPSLCWLSPLETRCWSAWSHSCHTRNSVQRQCRRYQFSCKFNDISGISILCAEQFNYLISLPMT